MMIQLGSWFDKDDFSILEFFILLIFVLLITIFGIYHIIKNDTYCKEHRETGQCKSIKEFYK